jgi:glycosyltransferase involved in cell wall biosynthesis
LISNIDTIGIALTSYNSEELFLTRQLNSILFQSYKNWKCCITIDGDIHDVFNSSTIKSILKDERFEIFFNEIRLGFINNFQSAIQKSLMHNPDAIIMADHDDEWKLNRLEVLRGSLIGLPDYSMVQSDMDIRIQESSNDYIEPLTVWNKENRNTNFAQPLEVLQRNIVGGATALIHSKLFIEHPTIPESIEYHDHWYALLSSMRGKIVSIKEPLYIYTQHGNNIAGASSFDGVFTIKSHQQQNSVFKILSNKWFRVNNLAKLSLEKTPKFQSPLFRLLFIYNFDLGFLNLLNSMRYFFRDKALFRASVSISIGKFLSIFTPEKNK